MITLKCYCVINRKRKVLIRLHVKHISDKKITDMLNKPEDIQPKLCKLTSCNNLVCNDVIPVVYN